MTIFRRAVDGTLRPVARLAARLRRRVRQNAGEAAPGAHAIARTRAGRIILVRLRYAPGWRLPGGGRGDDETPVEGALRELREEIGMTGHGAVTPLPHIDASLVLVDDVTYRPKGFSLEIERVAEADPTRLPDGISPLVRDWIAALNRHK